MATECLRIAAAERGFLLGSATTLGGSAEAGHDLYTQALLDCHDAIQRKGFVGTNYKFYLLQAIKWGNAARRRKQARLVPLVDVESRTYDEVDFEFQDAAGAFPVPTRERQVYGPPGGAPDADSGDELAASINAHLATYSTQLATAFRLHAAGNSYREIETLLGAGNEFSWVRRKVVKIKAELRRRFGADWVNLAPLPQ
jgi:hypothetical protein